MISATSLSSASSPHSLNKSPQIPLGLENGRLRVDSQKFLVPSLPVSARALSNDPSSKRRERSILNGTAHPSESHSSNNINGLRRSYSGSQLHQPQLHTSPRKDAQSSMYNGESNGAGMPTNPSNFLVRSSMPIPCSSPSPGSSASPNKSHSPSSSLQSSNNANGAYAPQLSPCLSDVNLSSPVAAAARLYPGGFHGLATHPAAAHLSPYYAAAAATHSLPYSIFGASSYNPHSGSSYLDNFHHSSLLAVSQMRTSSSPSPPRPASSYMPPQAPQQHNPHLPGPHTTSTTSLHNQLIESVGSGERYNGHNHNHLNNQPHHHHPSIINSSNNNSRFSNGGPGVSKTSPVGIGGTLSVGSTIQNVPPHSVAQHKVEQHQGVVESSSDKSFTSGNNRNRVCIDSPSPKSSTMANGNVSHLKEMEVDPKVPFGKEGSLKHHILTRSPDNLTPNSVTSHKNLHFHNLTASNGANPSGVLVDSNAKFNNQISSNSSPFLPPSPKNRSGQWNFAVPNSKVDLPPPSSLLPPSPSANPTGDSLKYLSNQTKNPSNTLTSNNSNNIINHSPKSPYLMTPPSSTSAQQFHFQFPNLKSTIHSNSNSPKNSLSSSHSPAATAYLSAPSTPTLPSSNHHNSNSTTKLKSHSNTTHKANPPVQIEEWPLLEAFQRGNFTRLPNGDHKRVEDISAEDLYSCTNVLPNSITIIHCTVISIQMDTHNSLAKIIMTFGSCNQEVIAEVPAGQPFFVIGRGWSSSSPALTEKQLQLYCTPLSVGDVCITLQRNYVKPEPNPTPAIATSTTLSSPPTSSNMVVPKSPSVKQSSSGKGNSYTNAVSKSKNAGGRMSGSGAAGKGSSFLLAASSSNNTNKSNRKLTTSNAKTLVQNGNAKAMLPPPTPPPPSNPHTNNTNNTYHSHPHHHHNNHHQQQQQYHHQPQQQQNQIGQPLSLTVPKRSPPMTDENDRPSSPKKRRWSAPEVVNDDNDSHMKIQV